MKIAFAFMTSSLNIFGGIDNSIYNLGLGFQAHGVEVLIYSSRVYSEDPVIGPFPVFRSAFLPTKLPEGHQHQTIVRCLAEQGSHIREEFFDFVKRGQVDCVITCDPVWGILQEAGACVGTPCPIVLSLHVINSLEVLKKAAELPYLFRQVVSPYLASQLVQLCARDCLVTCFT
jgi:hypothetical protein